MNMMCEAKLVRQITLELIVFWIQLPFLTSNSCCTMLCIFLYPIASLIVMLFVYFSFTRCNMAELTWTPKKQKPEEAETIVKRFISDTELVTDPYETCQHLPSMREPFVFSSPTKASWTSLSGWVLNGTLNLNTHILMVLFLFYHSDRHGLVWYSQSVITCCKAIHLIEKNRC